jgi:diaminopimelate decarboxylase
VNNKEGIYYTSYTRDENEMNELLSPFTRNNGSLVFDTIDLEKEVISRYGTPTFIFSERKIRENIHFLKESFDQVYPDNKIAYSLKNNTLPSIVSIIDEELDYFESTSYVELKLLEYFGLLREKTPLNIISTNLYKSDGLLYELITYPEAIYEATGLQPRVFIAIDSYQDLQNVQRIAKKLEKKPEVFIRVNPGIQMSKHKTIFASATPDAKCSAIISNTDRITSYSDDPNISSWLYPRKKKLKFDYAEKLIEEAYSSEHLNLVGIHGHLGSQVEEMVYFDHFFEAITIFYRIMQEDYGDDLEILDLGGGYPVQYTPKNEVPSLESIAQNLAQKTSKQKINPELMLESGRFVTASAGTLLTKITSIKENPEGGFYAFLDMSVYTELLDVLVAYWDYYPLLVDANENKQEKVPEKKSNSYTIVGATNDTLDQLSPRIIRCPHCQQIIKKTIPPTFSRDLHKDDYLAIMNTGAYTTCFQSNYCGRPNPIKLLIDNEEPPTIHLLKN